MLRHMTDITGYKVRDVVVDITNIHRHGSCAGKLCRNWNCFVSGQDGEKVRALLFTVEFSKVVDSAIGMNRKGAVIIS